MPWHDYIVDSDALPSEAYLRARYSLAVRDDRDVRRAAVQSLCAITERASRGGKVQLPQDGGPAVTDVGQQGRWTDVELAIPSMYWSPSSGIARLYELLASVVEYEFTDGIWLQGVFLPRSYLSSIPGPAFGTEGIRSRLQVPERPILAIEYGNVPLSQLHRDSRRLVDVLSGGFSIIADDIFLPNTGTEAQREQRIEALARICRIASERSGQPKLHFATIAGTPRQIYSLAGVALSAGAAGLIVNANSGGFGLLEDLSQMFPDLIIVNTNMGSGISSRTPEYPNPNSIYRAGISERVISKLSRLAGSDAVHAGTVGTECYDQAWGASITALTQRLPAGVDGGGAARVIHPSMKVVEGNMPMTALWANIELLGNDIIFEVPWNVVRVSDSNRQVDSWVALAEDLSHCRNKAQAREIYVRRAARNPLLKRQLNDPRVAIWM